MRSIHIFFLLVVLALGVQAQTNRKTSTRKAKTTVTKKSTKKNSTKKKAKGTTRKDVSTPSISGLKNEREQLKKQIAVQQKKLRNNERDVKQRLQNLMVINTEIADKRKSIDTIRRDINVLDGNIGVLNDQLVELRKELDDRKEKYVKSMHYMHRNRSIQNQLMFIFSAKNFTQMYRRMRFMREYASYQKVQGEMVKTKQKELETRQQELTSAKKQKHTLLYKGEQEKRTLESKQEEQQNVVSSLQKQQKTIKSIIDKQMQRDKAINAEIDRLVAIEVEKARQRAIAEAKRKAEAQKQVDEYNKNWYQNDNRSGTYSKKGSDISDSKVATGNKSSESRLRLENVERYEAYGKDVFGKGTSKFEGFKDPPTRDAVWDGQRYVDELLMLEDKRGK